MEVIKLNSELVDMSWNAAKTKDHYFFAILQGHCGNSSFIKKEDL